MQIRELEVRNFRSIVDSGPTPMGSIMALVGENNAGKSNILAALSSFLAGGAGGIKADDFYDKQQPVCIKLTFGELLPVEARRWKKYMVGGKLILEKHVWVEEDEHATTSRIKSDYHGYEAEPKQWFLSIPSIINREGNRPKWLDIAQANNLPDYFVQDGRCNKSIYSKALEKYLDENEVEYAEPDLSNTHALGLQSNVIASLPSLYLLPAITDYSDEIDKRQKSSTFRRLMAELSDRLLKNDPRIDEVEEALEKVRSLLNVIAGDGEGTRLQALEAVEIEIGALLKELMPSISSVRLAVQVDELKDIFAGGVALSVDDGVETDVLAKGHGLQRCIVFSLLRTLIETERGEARDAKARHPIILAIEEPELYVHPQLCKLFYDVIRAFAETDQVIYTTHSPNFVDAYNYRDVGIVRKASVEQGTRVCTAGADIFDGMENKKVFKGLSRFNPAVNELFFAKQIVVVEGPEDLIAVTETLKKLGKVKVRAEELGFTVLIAGGKQAIPFFQLVMNAFKLPYRVLHDLDITEQMSDNDKDTHKKTNAKIESLAVNNAVHTFPVKLESTVAVDCHLKDQFKATEFFSSWNNITAELEKIVEATFVGRVF